MLDEGIARLPVVRGGKLVGIVAREDIVRGVASGSGDSA
jgi:CBS domain-containing protein